VNPRENRNNIFFNQQASETAVLSATNSASVEDTDTQACFLLAHIIGQSNILNTKPVVDFLSTKSPPQSESTYPQIKSVPFVNINFKFKVQCK